jgi:hypothetical protein
MGVAWGRCLFLLATGGDGLAAVDLEFSTTEPITTGLVRHRAWISFLDFILHTFAPQSHLHHTASSPTARFMDCYHWMDPDLAERGHAITFRGTLLTSRAADMPSLDLQWYLYLDHLLLSHGPSLFDASIHCLLAPSASSRVVRLPLLDVSPASTSVSLSDPAKHHMVPRRPAD